MLTTTIISPNSMAEGTSIVDESINDISTVMALGAGGAVLGLSTLSFVDEPKDHLKNIVVGGSIGIIVGVGVVAWRQATKSKGLYDTNAELNMLEFSTDERLVWHSATKKKLTPKGMLPHFQYQFSF
jgi:hypothetical protein